jgi:hypothetical protein
MRAAPQGSVLPSKRSALMLSSGPSATVDEAAKECVAATALRCTRVAFQRRRSILAFFGLALAVVLWGFSYKLSLYQSHPDPVVRVQVAKLWVDQRNAAATVAPRAAAKGQRVRVSQSLALAERQDQSARIAARLTLPAPVKRHGSVDFLIPFRSPPSNSLSA